MVQSRWLSHGLGGRGYDCGGVIALCLAMEPLCLVMGLVVAWRAVRVASWWYEGSGSWWWFGPSLSSESVVPPRQGQPPLSPLQILC